MMTMMIIVLCIRLEKVSRRYNVKLLVILRSLLFDASERSCQSTRTRINSYSWPLVSTTDPILRRTFPSFS